MKKDENTVIMSECHCPYCEKDKAVLINKEVSRKWSLQLPAFGLKFLFSVLYLSFIHIFRYGMKLIEVVKKTDILTYCFCPECGNAYSLNAPKEITDEIADNKLYKIVKGKLIMGICKGISVLTEIPLLWIRIVTVIYGIVEIKIVKDLLELFAYNTFSYNALTSDIFKFFYTPLTYVIGLAVVIGEYFLFSLMLKTKKTEDEEEQQ